MKMKETKKGFGMTELKTLKDMNFDFITPNKECKENALTRFNNFKDEKLRQEAIKWLKVMNKEDWDNRTYITDVWKDFFNITDEDLKGDEK